MCGELVVAAAVDARGLNFARYDVTERKPQPLNDPRHTATHEAGHAVIGRVLTLLCGGATIVPDYEAGEAGHAITHDPWECVTEWSRRAKMRHDDAVWHARIITFMAGTVAEQVLLGAAQAGDGDDRYQIELMAEELDSDPAEWVRVEARLRAMTRMLVRRHRDRIERVADALIAKSRLTERQIDKLVGRSIDDLGKPLFG
jgi:ATP-dependent Zn protease